MRTRLDLIDGEIFTMFQDGEMPEPLEIPQNATKSQMEEENSPSHIRRHVGTGDARPIQEK
jgi:hypothetical protein